MKEAENIIEIDEIKKRLNELKELTERVDTNLKNMNSLITETVGQNVGVWDGESANEFRSSWSNLENDIPSYMKIFQQQVSNIELLIEENNKIENQN